LADGPAPTGPALAGRECGQLLRLWVDPPVRDHLPAPDPRLRDGHRRFGACRDLGHGYPRDTSLGSPARSLSPKPILIAGNLTSALGYAGFAFVDRPWQAFACAVVGGAGVGAARTANQTLLITLVTPEQRAASFALGRVASNLGLGSGATVAGFIGGFFASLKGLSVDRGDQALSRGTSRPIAWARAAPQAARCPASPGASVADSVTGLAGIPVGTTLTGSAQHLAGMAPTPYRNG
jgi:MFS family permease